MLITRIELENIKSYRHIVVDFRRGTTAISGANGAGKTTLVEAIGFALFGYLPYNQEQFVREGEKQGRVIVHIIGGDERPYVIERRCGSGARWTVFDEEANLRLEQRADVQDKLHELFGIDRERPLDSLFRDALGVPQGTFTSIFLDVASKRKQTFDALLQIEDYKTAADSLLETQKHYREQMHEQQGKIKQLEFEIRHLDDWREQLKAARLLDEEQKQRNVQWSQQNEHNKARESVLNEQKIKLQQLKNSYENSRLRYEHAQQRESSIAQQLKTAQQAQQVVITHQEAYNQYQQAEKNLLHLREEEKQRNTLRQQQAAFTASHGKVQGQLESLQERLNEVARARKDSIELELHVSRQEELERQYYEVSQKVTLYNQIVSEGKQLKERLGSYQQELARQQARIKEIEPLEPVAQRLHEFSQQLTELKVQRNSQENKQKALKTARANLLAYQQERDQQAIRLRKVEQRITSIESHRAEAEEMPGLQQQYSQFNDQIQRLEGNIEGYVRWKAESAGGQCPLLHEGCLNIKRQGIVSLESYFEGLLTEEKDRLALLHQQQTAVSTRMEQIQKFVDALNDLELYIERRDNIVQPLQKIEVEIQRIEREIAALVEELEALKQVDPQIKEVEVTYQESLQADKEVRELAGLRKQAEEIQKNIQRCEADLQERRQRLDGLQGSSAQLAQIEEEQRALNDPRSHYKALQKTIAQEGHFIAQFQSTEQRAADLQRQLQTIQEQLEVYATLDQQIGEQEALRMRCNAGYQLYLKHEQEARQLPEREQAYQQQCSATAQAEKLAREAEQAFQNANAAFDEQELQTIQAQIKQLDENLARLAQEMKHHQDLMNDLEQKIAQAEELLAVLEEARKEYQTLEDLHTMMEQFRKLIKEAAPFVLKAMLNDISAEANRIFGEIMGDRSAQLFWENDYEIILRRQGVNRTFAQLSGGEQMSAALAVRLALLKKLSTLNIAFFDEPTQNMDELRRMNLAEQIRRVRGFDQLIVISHDDTFEQGLDSLVRLHKELGETRLVSDDGLPSSPSPWFEPQPGVLL